MARTTVQHQEDRLTFPVDTLLNLRVVESVVEERTGRNNNKWEKLNVKFQIMGIVAIGGGGNLADYQNWVDPDDPQFIYGSVSFFMSDKPDNPLRNWVEALLADQLQGQALPIGFEFDTNMIAGRYCKGVTVQYDATATDPTTGVAFKRHKIQSLLPAGGGGMAMANQFTQPQGQPVQPQAQQGWGQPPQQSQQGWGQAPAPQAPQQAPQAPQQGAQQGWGAPGVDQGQQQMTFAQQQHQAYGGQPAQQQAPAQQPEQQQPQPPTPNADPWGTWGNPDEAGF